MDAGQKHHTKGSPFQDDTVQARIPPKAQMKVSYGDETF
jgi:hypothetical protein